MASKWLYFTKYGRKKKGQIPSIDLRARTSPQVKMVLGLNSNCTLERNLCPHFYHVIEMRTR